MGRWLVDGVDLSTYAWNVSSRASSWTIPAIRGENEEIANKHGRTYVPGKTFDEGKVHLEMWALGCNSDGTFPTDRSRQWKCRDNLQMIASLFTRVTGLVDLMRIESGGYGLVNYHPNPAAEGFVTGAATYANEVLNPAMTAVASIASMSNMMINPVLAADTGWQLYGNNLIPDGFNTLHRDDPTTMVERNYQGGSFENLAAGTGIGGSWGAGTNIALTAQSVAGGRGARVLQAIATGAISSTAVIITKAKVALAVGSNPYMRFKVRRIGTGSTTRTLGYRINYVDASNAVVTAGSWTTVTIPTGGTWADVSLPSLATAVPSGATGGFTIEWRAGEAWSSGEGIYFDALMVGITPGLAGEAGPYFDGADGWCSWSGTAYGSISDWKEQLVTEWSLPSQVAYHARVTGPNLGSSAQISFIAWRHAASGTQQFWYDIPYSGDTDVPYSLVFNARAAVSGCTVELMYSDDGTSWTSAVSKTVTSGATVSGHDLAGSWTAYSGEGVPASAGRIFAVRVSVPVQSVGTPALQIYALGVTSAPLTSNAGGSTSPNGQYVWEGATAASRVLIYRRGLWGLTGRHYMILPTTATANRQVAAIDARGNSEATAIRLNPMAPNSNAAADGMYFYGEFAAANGPGGAFSMRCVVDCLDGSGAVLGTFTGTTTAVNMIAADGSGDWTVVDLAVPVLTAGTVTIAPRWEIVGPAWSEIMMAANLMAADRGVPVSFFSGHDTGTEWIGRPDQSITLKKVTGPSNYRAVRGYPVTDAGGMRISATLTTDMTVETNVAIAAAGLINIGFSAACTADADLYAQVMVGTTMSAETYLGTVAATATLTDAQMTFFQGVVSSPGNMTAIRIVARKSSGNWTAGVQARFDKVYAYSNTLSGNPRQDGNWAGNPQWRANVSAWTVTADPVTSADASGLTTLTTTVGWTLKATGKQQVGNRRRLPCVSGDQVHAWAKVRCSKAYQLRIFWYTSSDVFISSVTVASGSTGITTAAGTVTAPATTAYCRVQVWLTSSPTGSDTIELFGVYFTKVAASRDYGALIDPTINRYVDGGMGSDWSSRAAAWEGSPNNSRTLVFPNVVIGWDTSLASSTSPNSRPPGSTGRAIVIPAVSSGSNSTSISTPVTVPYAFTSGELAIARRDTAAAVTLNVYGYDDAARSNPILLKSIVSTKLQEILTWRDVAVAQPYAGVQLYYAESSAAGGTAVYADNLLITSHDNYLGFDYPGYFDGSASSASWSGAKNNSTSTYYAGALQAFCERQNEVPIESQAGATRAEFTIDLSIPDAFWRDPADRQTIGTVTSLPGTITLDDFAGGSAPIEDLLIDIKMLTGTCPSGGLILTDVMSGAWIRYTEPINGGDTLRVDCKNCAVILNPADPGMVSWKPLNVNKIRKITKGGDARFFTANPGIAGGAPQITVSSTTTTFDGSIQLTVTGRRKYVIG